MAIARSLRMRKPKGQRKIIGSIGDCNALDYGGSIVYALSGDYGSGYELDIIEAVDEGAGSGDCDVLLYRICIEPPRQWIGDVALQRDVRPSLRYINQLPWYEIADISREKLGGWHGCPHQPSTYTEWWDDRLDRVASSCGTPVSDLLDAEDSEDPVMRACFFNELAQHFGLIEFDQDPIRMTRSEANRKYGRAFAAARKRGITLYT